MRTHPEATSISFISANRFDFLSNNVSFSHDICDPNSVTVSDYCSCPCNCSETKTPTEHHSYFVSQPKKLFDLGTKEPIVVLAIVSGKIESSCMIDCGATSQFMDYEFALKKGIPIQRKKIPEVLTLVDGQKSAAGNLIYEATVLITIGLHSETVTFQLTKIEKYPMILGMTWLALHNPKIDWKHTSVSFDADYCLQHCLPNQRPTIVPHVAKNPKMNIAMVSATAFRKIAARKNHRIYAVSVKDMEEYLSRPKFSDAEDKEKIKKLVPEDYHKFIQLFTKEEADKIPPRRYIDHAIDFEDGKQPGFGPLYSMSELELKVLKDYLDENLSKGFIRSSTSSASSPVLFVKKPDGGIRFCVDYRALNTITKKNRYPLPLINETLHQIQGAKIFTKLDLRSAFNLIRIKAGDEWKTAFRTRYGLFEYVVMPFGLTNAPATCQQFVNDTLRDYLDVFCSVYLDDILIYSKTLKEHKEHVKKILAKLEEVGLYCKPEKCEFHTTKTKFLGFIITPNTVEMDQKKIEAIQQWEAPKNITDLQSFLGFANFYRRFIHQYAKKCAPLFRLLKKESKFNWTPELNEIFESLKDNFCSAPVLRQFDPTLETIVECDVFDTVVAGVLSQKFPEDNKMVLHPIAYYSKKLSPAECNYGIGEKELLAIVNSFEEWHQYLEGTPTKVLTDHANLTNFMGKQRLSRRQARWAQFLSQYEFTIDYRPGTKNKKADALTRRSEDLPEEGDGRGRPFEAILQPNNFLCSELSTTEQPVYMEEKIIEALKNDALAKEIIKALETNQSRHPKVDLAECKYNGRTLTVYGLLYVPENLELQRQIIYSKHDHPAAGHPGRSATYANITRDYWWPGLRGTIARYIRNCDTCARIKPPRHSPFGLLKPLEVPHKRWQSISMDMITGLPLSEGFDAIFVVVDRLTKMAHFIPTTATVTSEGLAKLFFDKIFKHHGLPESIISDRGTTFNSRFSKELCSLLNIAQNISTAYHPETDGQTERINGILEQYIRGHCNYQQDNWSDLLTLAEFAYNNTQSATINVSPFFANYGFNPRYDCVRPPTQPTPTTDVLKNFTDRMINLNNYLQSEIKYAQASYAEFADRHRLPPPIYKEGDYVWLLRKNIHTTRPSNKLDFKRLGKFRISQKISTHAYRLDLPSTMRIHPVFHVSLLEPVANDPLPGQTQPPPPPVIVEENEEFEVTEILDSRFKRRGRTPAIEYLVKWTGYDHPTWEPSENLTNSPLAVEEFHTRYPSKPSK